MQGLHRSVILAIGMAWSVAAVSGPYKGIESGDFSEPFSPLPTIVATRTNHHIPVFTAAGLSMERREISSQGASFIKLHFSQFNLPTGIFVQISNPAESESWLYSAHQRDPYTFDVNMGDDGDNSFSAMSITGDTLIVRIFGDLSRFDPSVHRIEIDSWLEGYSQDELTLDKTGQKGGAEQGTRSDCGTEERHQAACFANSHPWEYERSSAVAKLITAQGEVCTAWRVGSNNHLLTAEHCLGRQSELDGAEIWFNYEAVDCDGSANTSAVKVTGGDLLRYDRTLDYSLFTVNDFADISGFPAFGLDTGTPGLGEEIFIPQHGLGRPRQIALESDMNASGLCEVDSLDPEGNSEDLEIGYYCDTTTSSSGSPVVSMITGKVIALHHSGGCFNSGVRISRIWPDISDLFGGSVPSGNSGGSGGGGDQSSSNDKPEAVFSVNCDELNCSFDGGSSSDPDGSVVDYAWNFGDGDSATGVITDHVFDEGGSFSVTLTVSDDEGSSDSQTQTVAVSAPNQDPDAKITTSCIANECTFSGGGSSDSDGNVESWGWNFGDGGSGSGKDVGHVYSAAGSYTISLTVEDDDGATDFTTRTITLTMPNESPEAAFTFDCSDVDCSFDASSSSDPDGQLDSWEWDFGDGSQSAGMQVNHAYAGGGTFAVTLIVSDDGGKSDTHSMEVNIQAANEAPEARFTFSCDGLDCDFDAGSSSDSDGELTSLRWDFGDGSAGSGEVISHTFSAEGSYSVVLTAEDDQGESDDYFRTVTVNAKDQQEESNLAPSAAFTWSCNEQDCTLDAGISSDPDGDVIEYLWSLGDGRQGTGRRLVHLYDRDGTFEVTLTVTDDKGDSDSETRLLTVASESDPEPDPVIELSAEGSSYNGRGLATLWWSGAQTDSVDIYRDGIPVERTSNDGKYLDAELETDVTQAEYRLCQAGSDNCSNTVLLNFGL